MDAAAALERLREISSQVRAAVIFERGGKVVGSTFADDQRAKDVAEEAEALLTEAEQRRDAAGADGRARLLRPQELPAGPRHCGPAEETRGPEAQACEPGEENRCEVVTFSPACCWARARSPGRCSSAGASRASESGWTCTSATGRWSRWRSQARLSRCYGAPAGSSSLQTELVARPAPPSGACRAISGRQWHPPWFGRSRPYFSSTNTPCVLPWLASRTPGIQK